MSSSHALCCFRSVKSKNMTSFFLFFFHECIIKQLLNSVFVIPRIIKVSVWVISLSLGLQLMSVSLTLIILDITKHHPIIAYNFMATC